MLDFNAFFNAIPIPTNPSTHVEIEVKFKTKPVYKLVKQYNTLLQYLRQHYTETTELSTVNQLDHDIRQIIPNTSDISNASYQQKKRINDDYRYIDDYGFVVSVSHETPVSKPRFVNVKNTRHRTRHIFHINDLYEVDLTEVQTTLVNTDRTQTFNEIELEYIGEYGNFNQQDFIDNIKTIYSIINQSENLISQNQITALIKNVNNAFGISDTQHINKDILVKARNIKYVDLINGAIVNNPTTSYVISHKADGERHYLIFNNVGMWLVSSTYFNLVSTDDVVKSDRLNVYECEVIKNINDVKYYVLVYDCLVINNKDIIGENLAFRMQHIDVILNTNSTYELIKKPVYPLTLSGFFDTLQMMFNMQSTLPYPQDGFIITPAGIYNYNSDKLPLH